MRTILTTEQDRDQAIDYLKRLAFGKRRYVFDIKVWRKPRSLKQNRLERLWLKCLADETGNDADDLHEFFKKKFLEPRRATINGETIEVPASTTTLDTAQFTTYLDKMAAFSQDFFGVILPQPDSLGWDDLVARYGDR